MKKSTMIGSTVFILGLVVFFCAFAASGGDISKLSTQPPYEEKQYVSTTETHAILVDASAVNILFGVSDDDNIHITYYENEKESYEMSNDGELRVKKVTHYAWYDHFFDMNFQDHSLMIFVPQDYIGDITAETSSGTIKTENVSADHMDFSTSNGSIRIQSADIQGDINADTTNGSISLSDVCAANEIKAASSNGSVNYENVSGTSISATTSNGSITVSNLNVQESLPAQSESILDLQTSNGSIRGNIVGKMGDFTIHSEAVVGKNNLPESLPGGDKQLYVKTNNGTIDIHF